MRRLRRVALVVGLLLVVLMFVLGRLAGADPTVELSRALRDAGYRDASVVVLRGEGDAGHVVVKYDPEGRPAAEVATLSRQAAERVWTTGEIRTGSLSVQPRVGARLELPESELAAFGTPPADRQSYDQITSRARIVIALAGAAVLLAFTLVIIATSAAVSVARRRARASRI